MRSALFLLATLPTVAACSSNAPTYREDAEFLAASTNCYEFASGTGAFLVAPALQGRVMTAGVTREGPSLGFVNRGAIAAPDWEAAFANFGGAERFWIGPESGPFAFFFDAGDEHTRDNWRVPASLNRGTFEVIEQGPHGLTLQREIELSNLQGTRFAMRVRRAIDAPAETEVAAALGGQGGTLNAPWTAFRSRTTVTNIGQAKWTRAGGLPCIWVLGMFAPGSAAWAIAPFGPQADPDAGPPVRADYFGQVPPDRFKLGSNFALFRVDAKQVGKIGVLRNRAGDRIAAWNPDTRVFTLLVFGPVDRGAPYMSESWGTSLPDPYYGDVVNSYNHGGPEPFFELETSSRALELAPNAAHRHECITIMVQVPSDAMLDALLRSALGIDPAEFHRLER